MINIIQNHSGGTVLRSIAAISGSKWLIQPEFNISTTDVQNDLNDSSFQLDIHVSICVSYNRHPYDVQK